MKQKAQPAKSRSVGHPRTIKVTEAVDNFLCSKSLNTSAHYIETISGFMSMFTNMYGKRTVSSLTLDDMERYAAYLQRVDKKFAGHPKHPAVNGKLSKSTIDSHHRTLRTFFNWLVKRPEYGVKQNLMLEIPRPRIFENDVKIKRVEWITYQKILDAAKSIKSEVIRTRAIALLYFLLDTGCRAEGVCTLRWSDIDLSAHRAYVVEKFGKGRAVFFLPITREAIEAWRRVMPKNEYMFCSTRDRDIGQPLTPSGLYQIIVGLSEKAGLPREKWITPHMIRHMFATMADEAQISIEHLQALMGHEKATTTQRYIHRGDSALKAAHDKCSPLHKLVPADTHEIE